jgi:hypothetical protein
MDRINDKYGEFLITPALMMGMDDTIIDRIAFGGVGESTRRRHASRRQTRSFTEQDGTETVDI